MVGSDPLDTRSQSDDVPSVDMNKMHQSQASEAAIIDPHIPFRAVPRYHHHTWAGTFNSYPQKYIQPHDLVELRKVVKLASRCRRRISLTGCGHSPSDLTCTSQWLVNLDYLDNILDIDEESGVVIMEAGIRLHDLTERLKENGLAMPNLGSIDHQSIAGAMATSTHGSSLRHGLISQSVRALKIMLADGSIVTCSEEENLDLFRAALVSLGALGIIVEVTFQAVPFFKLEWEQTLLTLEEIVQDWNRDLWTKSEFTRCWWMPYTKRAIRWRAGKTDKPTRRHEPGWFSGKVGYHVYQFSLYLGIWIPQILPMIEKFVHTLHYGSHGEGKATTGVEEGHKGLLMDCLYSQLVNEWAIPLSNGQEALSRLSAWLNGEPGSGIPFSSSGVYVHAPIEVRVSDNSTTKHPRPFLDFTNPEGPTLFLNATLYRPFHREPLRWKRYYEAFEYLMKELDGRPHWAKNFVSVSKEDLRTMYPKMDDWLQIRNDVDPEGMFVGDWHRRLLLRGPRLPLEERLLETRGSGDLQWFGEMARSPLSLKENGSEESYDWVGEGEDERIRLNDHEK